MNPSRADELQDRAIGLCMILAPLFLLASSIMYWQGSGTLGGALQVYAFFLFIPVMFGLTGLLWDRMPRLAVIARGLLIFGCVGGITYGIAKGYQAAAENAGVGATVLKELETIQDSGLPLALNIPGITLPLVLAALGIVLWRTRMVPAWSALTLALAGLMFPLSRIPNVELLYYIADGLFVVSISGLGLRRFTQPQSEQRQLSPAR